MDRPSSITEDDKIKITNLVMVDKISRDIVAEMFCITSSWVNQICTRNNPRVKKIKEVKENNIKTRKQECLKCHKTFDTELDKQGIPFKKICPSCTENNRYIKGHYSRGVHKSNSRSRAEE
jgi:hypothetical protein